jgi:phage protein D
VSPLALQPAATVRLDGRDLAPEVAELLVSLQVRDSVRLPDQAVLRLADPYFTHVDDSLLTVGKTLEILLGASGASSTTPVFSGKVQSLELELVGDGTYISATAYEPAFALHQNRRTQAFQNMTAADIASKVIADAGLTASADATTVVYEFMLQSDETDWEFLWRLAGAVDFEVVGEGDKVHFRKAGTQTGSSVELAAPDPLLSFRPRVSGAQQASSVSVRGWDPATQQGITATETPGSTESKLGLERSTIATAAGQGTWTVADRTVVSQAEADQLGQSLMNRIVNAWVEADGVCSGLPSLRAGSQVTVSEVGTRYGGTYLVTSTTHTFSRARGYETQFTVSGRGARTLLDLVDTSRERMPWGSSLIVGVVTQTSDPDGLGRIRVKYPSVDENAEGWWARIAAPAAGTGRGMLMMPLVGDEVVLGFEKGDPRRPYVIGAVWNGKAKPGDDLVKQDGSFALASDKDIVMTAQQAAKLTAPKGDLTLQGKALTATSDGDLQIKGATVTVQSDGTVTIKGGSVTVQAGESLQLTASGMVKISGASVMLG